MSVKIISKTIISAVILNLVFFNFSLALEAPKDFKEAGDFTNKTIETTKKEVPSGMKRVWQEEVLPIWKRMYDWSNRNIWTKITGFWQNAGDWFMIKVKLRTVAEVEKRKRIAQEEFQKEKKELQTEAPQLGKNIWERFKDLFK